MLGALWGLLLPRDVRLGDGVGDCFRLQRDAVAGPAGGVHAQSHGGADTYPLLRLICLH